MEMHLCYMDFFLFFYLINVINFYFVFFFGTHIGQRNEVHAGLLCMKEFFILKFWATLGLEIGNKELFFMGERGVFNIQTDSLRIDHTHT